MDVIDYMYGSVDRAIVSQQDAANALRHAALNAPEHALCGCPACDDGVQQGHFACEQPPLWALQAESSGLVVRAYDDGAWRWFRV